MTIINTTRSVIYPNRYIPLNQNGDYTNNATETSTQIKARLGYKPQVHAEWVSK